MGACLSCLGLGQHPADDEPSETERLLYDETAVNTTGYGAAGRGASDTAPDPEELRRHREMLERICAETANNLIDVQHTNHLTLRGKPSAEFTKLLNNHFVPAPSDHSADPEPPKTPVNNLPSSPPEPPSPFTQAQLQAAAQNGRTTTAMMPSTFATISEHAVSDPQIPQPSPQRRQASQTSQASQERAKEPGTTDKGDEEDEDEQDQDEAAEETWLASIKAQDSTLVRWDEVKQPSSSLVVDLESDANTGGKPK